MSEVVPGSSSEPIQRIPHRNISSEPGAPRALLDFSVTMEYGGRVDDPFRPDLVHDHPAYALNNFIDHALPFGRQRGSNDPEGNTLPREDGSEGFIWGERAAAAMNGPLPQNKLLLTKAEQKELVDNTILLTKEMAATYGCCPICRGKYAKRMKVTVLLCETYHIFHPKCIARWLKRDRACPICRRLLCEPNVEPQE